MSWTSEEMCKLQKNPLKLVIFCIFEVKNKQICREIFVLYPPLISRMTSLATTARCGAAYSKMAAPMRNEFDI